MIKVAAIIPPSSRNLGNEFFALGGIEAFSQTFSHVEKEISVIEFFDSGENSYGQSKTPLFTDSTLNWIKKDVDLVVLFGGCCLRSPLNRDTDLKHLFDVLFSTGKPFLGWGLSPTLYTEADVDYAKEVADHPNTLALITRDDIICQKIGDYNKIISGMDGGFWMGESFKGADRSSNYSVVNLEQSNQLDVAESVNTFQELSKQSSDPVYMVSNNCELAYYFRHPRSLQITSAQQLWSTYANASYVITTRAHTTICCLTSGTPIEYRGILDDRVVGLMMAAGIDLNGDEDLTPEECATRVQESKNSFMEKIRSQVDISICEKN